MSRSKYNYSLYKDGFHLLDCKDIHKISHYLNNILQTDIYTYNKIHNYFNRRPQRLTGFKNIEIKRELIKKET